MSPIDSTLASAGPPAHLAPANYTAEPGGEYTYVYRYEISDQDLKVLEKSVPAFAAGEISRLESFLDKKVSSPGRRKTGDFDEESVKKLKLEGIEADRVAVRGI
jgi:hypothetical protein